MAAVTSGSARRSRRARCPVARSCGVRSHRKTSQNVHCPVVSMLPHLPQPPVEAVRAAVERVAPVVGRHADLSAAQLEVAVRDPVGVPVDDAAQVVRRAEVRRDVPVAEDHVGPPPVAAGDLQGVDRRPSVSRCTTGPGAPPSTSRSTRQPSGRARRTEWCSRHDRRRSAAHDTTGSRMRGSNACWRVVHQASGSTPATSVIPTRQPIRCSRASCWSRTKP